MQALTFTIGKKVQEALFQKQSRAKGKYEEKGRGAVYVGDVGLDCVEPCVLVFGPPVSIATAPDTRANDASTWSLLAVNTHHTLLAQGCTASGNSW
jgi:polysaccharide deacetylase 2 family uncharacterized protein YibQ